MEDKKNTDKKPPQQCSKHSLCQCSGQCSGQEEAKHTDDIIRREKIRVLREKIKELESVDSKAYGITRILMSCSAIANNIPHDVLADILSTQAVNGIERLSRDLKTHLPGRLNRGATDVFPRCG